MQKAWPPQNQKNRISLRDSVANVENIQKLLKNTSEKNVNIREKLYALLQPDIGHVTIKPLLNILVEEARIPTQIAC
jgi:hypothetical protein